MGDWLPQSDLAGLEIILFASPVSVDNNRDNPSDGRSYFGGVLMVFLYVPSVVCR
jgi:hypothetical protein